MNMDNDKNELTLREKWVRTKSENPRMRQRDIAEVLNISEGTLVASELGNQAVKLKGDWMELIESVEGLGHVMALTRNASAVIETEGVYETAEKMGPVGLVVGENIDLRLFLNSWDAGFALPLKSAKGSRLSLQFFNQAGAAVHKIFATERTNAQAFEELIEKNRADEQEHTFERSEIAPQANAPLEGDRDALIEDWRKLQDTHDFVDLLRKHEVTRKEALILAEGVWSYRGAVGLWEDILNEVVVAGVPIMTFVGSTGVLQIRSGEIVNLKRVGDWYNILQPDFNLHLLENKVAETWVVKKPTVDGIVTSVELYDQDDGLILTLFGKRKPGIPEDQRWRACVQRCVGSATSRGL